MKQLIYIIVCCCLVGCTQGNNSTSALSTDTAPDTVTLGDTAATGNPFPLLAYPADWYFGNNSNLLPADAAIIPYQYLDLHYRTFESVAREYGGPAFYREIEYRNSKLQSAHGYGNTELLDSILKNLSTARVMLFHWENIPHRDSSQPIYDMDLYFLSDGDSLRAIYGTKTRR